MKDNETQIWTISTGTFIRAAAVVGAIALAYVLRDLILVMMTSVIIASAVEPAARALSSFRIPRVVSVLAIYVLFFVILFSVLYIFIPPLFLEISDIAAGLPKAANVFDFIDPTLDPLSAISGGLATSISLQEIVTKIQDFIASQSTGILDTTTSLFGSAFSLILIIVISFYLVVQEDGIDNFIRLVVPLNKEAYVLGLWRRSQQKIGQWMKGQLLLGLIVGLLVYLGLTIFQIKYALVLAIIAAVFELIPFFGPILSAVPAVLLGFSIGPVQGVMVAGLYLVIQQFENHLIYPLVVRKIVGMPPIIAIIALIIGAQLAGFIGLILAAPVAMILLELLSDYSKKKHVFRQALAESKT
jgi:predicted PurR-regulated permease PerM